MQEDFLTKIRSAYNQFTKAEKKVADYILQNPDQVLFMSISDLAETCKVGDTSVFRFCKTMNVKGYQEFKMTLSLSMRGNGKESKEGDGGNVSLQDNNIMELAGKVLEETIDSIKETHSLLDFNKVTEAMNALSKAKRILFFGVGASMLTAMKAMNKFHRIEPKVYCSEMVSQQLMSAATMERGDVAVIFSYSGATRDIVEIAKLAKESGATVVSITRFQKSELTDYTDILLLCGANVGSLQKGSTSAEISQLFLVDIMYTEYYRRHYEYCNQILEKTTVAIKDRN
nr:MurR/RpiR family transcriptional regulator [uncultured Oribacterium sp.]